MSDRSTRAVHFPSKMTLPIHLAKYDAWRLELVVAFPVCLLIHRSQIREGIGGLEVRRTFGWDSRRAEWRWRNRRHCRCSVQVLPSLRPFANGAAAQRPNETQPVPCLRKQGGFPWGTQPRRPDCFCTHIEHGDLVSCSEVLLLGA